MNRIKKARTMKITEALLAEHLVFHNLFDHIEKVAPDLRTVDAVKSLASLTQAMLSAHTDTEDKLFMGPLEPSFEQIGQRETFHEEHTVIDQNFALVKKATQAKKARELLLATIVLCRRHFDKEERIVFPMAERILKSKTLLALGESWMNQRNGTT
jgi:hemerythrin-like domain-containing protein